MGEIYGNYMKTISKVISAPMSTSSKRAVRLIHPWVIEMFCKKQNKTAGCTNGPANRG